MTAGQRRAGSPPHPDLDTLADLDAGILEGAEAERVGAHVAGCARCEQVVAALRGVRADLRALPAPPIPAPVAARLDSTLADLRADHPAPVAAAPAAPVADLGAARERRWRRLTTAIGAVAAGFAVVVAGVSIGSVVRSNGSDTSAGSGSGGGLAEQRTAERHDNSAGGGGAGSGEKASAPSAPSALPPLPSYDEATLRAALPTLAKSYPVTRVAQAGESGPAGVMADAGRRAACAQAVPGHQGVLRAVRWIRYQGVPAYAFLFEDAGRTTAYVVGEQCGATPSVPAPVLDSVR